MNVSKRIFDLIITIPGLIILFPLFLLIAIAIKVYDNGPVLYKQKRIGRNGKIFTMVKFRTMVPDADKKGKLITVGIDARITRVGKILRKYKLDEFPQLFNVLRGEMSLVGPRPEVEKYVKIYTPEQKKVLSLHPGITDPASIIFFNESELLTEAKDPEKYYIERIMPLKIKINLDYAIQSSRLKDFIVIIKTLGRLFIK